MSVSLDVAETVSETARRQSTGGAAGASIRQWVERPNAGLENNHPPCASRTRKIRPGRIGQRGGAPLLGVMPAGQTVSLAPIKTFAAGDLGQMTSAFE
jgi:hypothetical protein